MKNNYYYEQWTDDCRFGIESELIESKQTKFQKIDFYKSNTFKTFFTLDDLMMVTQKDEFIYHDMIVHPAMATNPNIKSVLIIGGGDGGTAREVLRYKSIENVVMCEIDEEVFRMCQKHLPQTAAGVEEDSRMKMIFDDGLAYVKNCEDGKFDLILVDSTDPISVGEGLFTTEFYKECYRVLTSEGILINQHESPYFDQYSSEMKKSHNKIKQVFDIAQVYQFHMPTYPSGHWLFGFASKKYHPVNDINEEAWKEFGIKTKYYNPQVHVGSFMLPTYVVEMLNE